MSYNTGTNNQVNGGVFGGEFLTGKMDFFSITTLVPMDQTKVNTPVDLLYQISSTVWSPVTVVDGKGEAVTYASKNDYIAAYGKEQNLNNLIKLFSSRANPVAISASVASVGDVTGMFGSAYTGSADVATINIATEKTGYWYAASQGNFYPGYGETVVAADDSNANGYLLASLMDNVPVINVGSVLLDAFFVASGANQNFKVARRISL